LVSTFCRNLNVAIPVWLLLLLLLLLWLLLLLLVVLLSAVIASYQSSLETKMPYSLITPD